MSFYSDAQPTLDPTQEAKMKKLAKPFSVTKKSSIKLEEIDDMLSEISTPGLDQDLAAQKRYIDSLLNKPREEVDLEDCFEKLKQGSKMGAKEFDDSVSEYSANSS